VRAISALIVFLGHARGNVFVEWGALEEGSKNILTFLLFFITRLGHEGVIAFFIISGYLVAGNAIDKVSKGEFLLQDFLAARLARIWTPLIPAILFSWLMSRIIYLPDTSYKDMLINFLGLQSIIGPVFGENAPLWSLAYEIWFYIVVGLLCLFITTVNKLRCSNTTTNIRLSVISFILLCSSLLVFSKLNALYLLIWFFGAGIYFIDSIQVSKIVKIGILVLGFISILCSQATTNSVSINMWAKGVFSQEFADILVGLSFSLVILGFKNSFISEKMPVNFIRFVIKPIKVVSLISYSLYITHYTVLILLKNIVNKKFSSISYDSLVIYGINVFLGLFVAFMFYWLFEKRTPIVKKFICKIFYVKFA
jgi:peptidoglycan/LPS O-acetylase OafA/YrhL